MAEIDTYGSYDNWMVRMQEHAAQQRANEEYARYRHVWEQRDKTGPWSTTPTPPLPPVKLPQVVNAYDAHLTEEGLVIEVDARLRVRIPAPLMKRLVSLLEIAALARLVEPEPNPGQVTRA